MLGIGVINVYAPPPQILTSMFEYASVNTMADLYSLL